jgi:hypothetical protein
MEKAFSWFRLTSNPTHHIFYFNSNFKYKWTVNLILLFHKKPNNRFYQDNVQHLPVTRHIRRIRHLHLRKGKTALPSRIVSISCGPFRTHACSMTTSSVLLTPKRLYITFTSSRGSREITPDSKGLKPLIRIRVYHTPVINAISTFLGH